MKSFDYLWQLLAPASVYENKKNMCKELWYSFPLIQQRTICLFLNLVDSFFC